MLSVQVTAHEVGPSPRQGRASEGHGWVATEGSREYAAPTSEKQHNQTEARETLDDLQTAFASFEGSSLAEAQAHLAAARHREESEYEGETRYGNLVDLDVEVSDYREDGSVLAKVVIAPNSTEDDRRLRADRPAEEADGERRGEVGGPSSRGRDTGGQRARSGDRAAEMGAGNVAMQDADASKGGGAVVEAGKWDYLFGRAAGAKNAAHNAPRTAQNLQQMRRLGVPDNDAGRAMLQGHFDEVVQDPSNVVRTWTNEFGPFEARESLFAGPGGFAKFETS